MMLMCNDIVIIENDGRRAGLPNAPAEQRNLPTSIALNINPPYSHIHIFPYSHIHIFTYCCE